MKDHFVITISDLFGSRYYTIKKSTKHRLAGVLAMALAAFSISLGYNYHQRQKIELLHDKNAYVEQESAHLSNYNDRLHEEVAAQAQMSEIITQKLGEFERLTGFEDASWNDAPEDLVARADAVSLSVRQASLLHRSIPNGYPLAGRIVTSKFGYRIHPVTKVRAFHNGIDLRAKGRVDVHAAADGIVSAANRSPLSGNRIILQHNFGFESYYAHLHKMLVEPGDFVHKGELIGLSGNSGQSAGPHLHYEIRYLNEPLDPTEFMEWELGSPDIFNQVKVVQWPSLIKLIRKQITPQTLQLSQRGLNLPGT